MRSHTRGLTLVEAAISTVIVAVLMISALNTVGSAQVSRQKGTDQIRAQLLAQELMAEILSKPYDDPNGAGLLGIDLAEILGINRLTFDDVDDYDGLSDSPPSALDGVTLDGFDSRWTRSVTVRYVDPASPTVVIGSDAGAKQITVAVTHNHVLSARLVTIRTRGWQGGSAN